ncbi:MAG: RNA 2',3'-cyclic phosphodiesterase [Candidatus Altiarchaeota archaeon]|nr:RNA 2',3'-cyclic phosphodiesterase [Candidatus Altiarchaeota archaeon]
MPRCFIGIKPDPYVLEKINPVLDRLSNQKGVKPVALPNIHLTLKFLGEINEKACIKLFGALRQISSPKPSIKVVGLGCFPHISKPKIIWAGIDDGSEEITALQKSIDEICSCIGFERDIRFHPHMTLARVKEESNSKNIKSLVEEYHGFSFGSFTAYEFIFFQSKLTPQGPIYSQASVFPLL